MKRILLDCGALGLPELASSNISEYVDPTFQGADRPRVFRGLARHWPAVTRWSFDYLSTLDPRRIVSLVAGNRELDATMFTEARLGEYLRALIDPVSSDEQGYLKEFDLLKAFPMLLKDLRTAEIFPKNKLVANSVWIGPHAAHTGLHYDYLDNLAILLRGRKRFYLAPPGTIEALGLGSKKYDRWAKLARANISEIKAARNARFVDLNPGDVLFVPNGWWHEVINIESSILLSGFFGSRSKVFLKWLKTGVIQQLHNRRLIHKTSCTCHPQNINR